MARKKSQSHAPRRQLPRRVPPLTVSRAFGQRSPLVDVDLPAFLARCMSTDSWNTYSASEKQRIVESLPTIGSPKTVISMEVNAIGQQANTDIPTENDALAAQSSPDDAGTHSLPLPLVDFVDLANDSFVKSAAARFKRDLQDGYYEKIWQDKAKQAHEDRLNRKFDEFVKGLAEEMFENGSSSDCDDGKDELALDSDDGEYLEKSQRHKKGRG